jgi:hypothetical protein
MSEPKRDFITSIKLIAERYFDGNCAQCAKTLDNTSFGGTPSILMMKRENYHSILEAMLTDPEGYEL